MSQFGPTHQQLPGEPQRGPRGLRLALLSLITLCGLLMIFIAASDPRVVAKIQYSAEYVSTGFANPDQIGSARPVLLLGLDKGEDQTSRNSSAQSSMAFRAKRRAAGFMPGDNVPVRRGGILN